MCGICGFTSGMDENEKKDRIHKMMDTISHRGPDDARHYIDEDIALGFRRLAIIDLKGGRQPLSNEDHTLWIVFNGEIYNFQPLREELLGKGHVFRTRSDTETIIHAYEEWGTDCLKRLRGMFAFAIWDSQKKEVFLAADRVGIKSLYYTETGSPFMFASEAKSIFASGFLKPEINNEVIPYHMAFLWSPFPLTIFRNIKKLRPGHYLIHRNGKSEEHCYWDLPIHEETANGLAPWVERTQNAIEDAVRSHMISDVPLGAFLSGGIDSSAICSYMKQLSPDRISTYFIAFSDEDLKNEILMNEEPYADIMAQELDSIHRKIVVSPDAEKLIHDIVWHLDEPVGDSASITTYLVSKAARETLTVLLSGVGGDEVFAGYPRYLAMKLLRQYNKIPKWGQNLISNLAGPLPGGKNAFFRNIKKFIKSAEDGEFDAYMGMLCYFNKEEQKRLFAPDFYSSVKDVDIFSFHRDYYEKSSGLNWLNRLQYLDFKTFLPCLNLMYTDKMSMAASIEVRVPFLDHVFAENMFQIPSEYKLKGKERKYIFKKSMENDLPDKIIWRKKTGFGAPIHAWISGKLRDMTEDYLSEYRLKKQGIFNYEYIRTVLDSEYANKEYYSNHIWQLLTFQIWYDRFLG
jgi:asparagine synthase (glutamine-hydrolysing)